MRAPLRLTPRKTPQSKCSACCALFIGRAVGGAALDAGRAAREPVRAGVAHAPAHQRQAAGQGVGAASGLMGYQSVAGKYCGQTNRNMHSIRRCARARLAHGAHRTPLCIPTAFIFACQEDMRASISIPFWMAVRFIRLRQSGARRVRATPAWLLLPGGHRFPVPARCRCQRPASSRP